MESQADALNQLTSDELEGKVSSSLPFPVVIATIIKHIDRHLVFYLPN